MPDRAAQLATRYVRTHEAARPRAVAMPRAFKASAIWCSD
jgi:hypothetical protein